MFLPTGTHTGPRVDVTEDINLQMTVSLLVCQKAKLQYGIKSI